MQSLNHLTAREVPTIAFLYACNEQLEIENSKNTIYHNIKKYEILRDKCDKRCEEFVH